VQGAGRRGTRSVIKYADRYLPGCDFGYEYSPEIFMDTELDSPPTSARRSWTSGKPAPGREIILNLP